MDHMGNKGRKCLVCIFNQLNQFHLIAIVSPVLGDENAFLKLDDVMQS